MTRKSKSKPKTPRAREYTGPNTLESVKEFCLSNATKKAKQQAAESLSAEDQVELGKWAIKRLLDAMDAYRKRMDAEWERRGI
jgi:hypothetical protein